MGDGELRALDRGRPRRPSANVLTVRCGGRICACRAAPAKGCVGRWQPRSHVSQRSGWPVSPSWPRSRAALPAPHIRTHWSHGHEGQALRGQAQLPDRRRR